MGDAKSMEAQLKELKEQVRNRQWSIIISVICMKEKELLLARWEAEWERKRGPCQKWYPHNFISIETTSHVQRRYEMKTPQFNSELCKNTLQTQSKGKPGLAMM